MIEFHLGSDLRLRSFHLLGHGHNVFSTSRGTTMSLATSSASINVLSFSHNERHLFPISVARNARFQTHSHRHLAREPRHLERPPRKQVSICFSKPLDRHPNPPDKIALVIYCTEINLPVNFKSRVQTHAIAQCACG